MSEPISDSDFSSFLPGRQEDDRSLIVTFFTDKKLLGAKSLAAGREIYEDRDFVKIQIKGQDKQVVVEEVRPYHKQKYPVAWQVYQSGKPAPVIGTPIEQLPGMGPSTAYNMKALGIRSIEDLANINDDIVIQGFGMGGRDLVKKAKAFLQHATENELSLQQENERLKGQVSDLTGQMQQLMERMAAMENSKTSKRRKEAQSA